MSYNTASNKQSHSIMNNFFHSKRSEAKQADCETASISSYASSTSDLKTPSSRRPLNGTQFSVEDLNNKAFRSQMRLN